MISGITLKFGAKETSPPLNLTLTPITVFVGPNNSGKSKILMEIDHYCRRTEGQTSDLILDNVRFQPYTREEFEYELAQIEQPPRPGESLSPEGIYIGKVDPQTNREFRVQVNKEQLIRQAQESGDRRQQYAIFLNLYTVRLDGTNRLNLLNDQNAGDLQTKTANHLAHLFLDNHLRAQLRQIVFDAFNKYFVLDPTYIGQLRVRLSDRAPADEREEKGWEQRSVEFHRNAVEIKYASDGVKAFAGIMATILAGDPKIALIDEPEAFLHPALSYKLGKAMGTALGGSNRRMFAATHSASFLMGCIQSGVPLNIVRLTYNYHAPTARALPADKLLTLMRNPLLRSTGVLNGLFYESVIVTEADSDRAFYQEVNERLLDAGDDRGIPSCLFLNAQNKQTVWEIVKPLRELGIPALGIVDIDVLKDGGQVFAKPLEGAFVPAVSHDSFHRQRTALYARFIATGRDMKRDGGINLLSGSDREAAENLLSQLRDYGILIVPGGELESWMGSLGVSGHGSGWLINVFEKMGDAPDSPEYVRPTSGNVWDFIGQARQWLADPNRKGIPAL